MRLLLITDEVWNDKIHGNNILTNWFEGMDIEIANIYCSPGMPDNQCCQKYFQITDGMMAKSILKRNQKAGRYRHKCRGRKQEILFFYEVHHDGKYPCCQGMVVAAWQI